ncbi:hypothetical protein ABK905_14210 [Acerihabitans sp. KWT182]|uniref:Uncharacterized protein n=1 Tax=Acerihabitans sp. KWT182 TaxID=3157919 RepID=A0AAU7Q4H6_9GAMM
MEPSNIRKGQISKIFHIINNVYDKCTGPEKLFAAYIAAVSKNFLSQHKRATNATFAKAINDAVATYPRLFSVGERLLTDFPFKDTMEIEGEPYKPLPGFE